jgi:hypothetical protein
MGDNRGPLRRRHSGIGGAVPKVAAHRSFSMRQRSSGGIIMNTAMARRLALGDRVIWMGKDDCQPSGPGTITRITAHQVEVLWEGATARRYRRAQLHNLLHVNHLCGGGARCKPDNRLGLRGTPCSETRSALSCWVGPWGDGAR